MLNPFDFSSRGILEDGVQIPSATQSVIAWNRTIGVLQYALLQGRCLSAFSRSSVRFGFLLCPSSTSLDAVPPFFCLRERGYVLSRSMGVFRMGTLQVLVICMLSSVEEGLIWTAALTLISHETDTSFTMVDRVVVILR